MLTKDLMRVTIRKGVVTPGWLDPTSDRDLNRAQRLIDVFEAHVGATRRELDDVLAVETGAGRDFRVLRGLAKLVMDRTKVSVAGELNPSEVRQWVFEAAAAVPVGTADRRAVVLGSAAEHFGVDADEVDDTLFADLSANQRILAVKSIPAVGLLHRYNVALAQGVVLKAQQLRITVRDCGPKRLRQLMRFLKFHRLMFRMERTGRAWRFVVDGPTSVLKHSTRYGINLANFLPALLLCEAWELEADYEPKRGGKSSVFRLDESRGLASHYRDTGTWVAAEEEALATRMTELADGWSVKTDGVLHDLAGHGVVIPDLVVQCPDTLATAMIEVVWRWRRGALENRWETLQAHGPANLVLAVCTSGQDEEFGELPGAVHRFKQVPNARKLWKLAREIASKG
jgi:predicted nuclease of restriction endonuclease-like RecB superfamily